jgi:hypothetical protein
MRSKALILELPKHIQARKSTRRVTDAPSGQQEEVIEWEKLAVVQAA